MKIVVEEREEKPFYNEVVFIQYYFGRLLYKPNSKVYEIDKHIRKYMILCIIFIIISIIMYILTFDNLYVFTTIIFTVLFISYVRFNKSAKIMVDNYLNNKDKITIDINGTMIKYTSSEAMFKIKWEDIKYVIINKSSISFIPSAPGKMLVSISVKYKDELVKYLSSIDRENLIVDNSNLYK